MSKTTLENEDDRILTQEEYLQKGIEILGPEVGPEHPLSKKVARMHKGIELFNPMEKQPRKKR
jgi:hypothetical protein